MDVKELPLRKCVACGQMLPKDQLFRLVKSSQGVQLEKAIRHKAVEHISAEANHV